MIFTAQPPVTKPRPFWEHSSFFQMCLAEREEILRHKWLESEKVGRDIGYDRAVIDWVRRYRPGWFRSHHPDLPPGA